MCKALYLLTSGIKITSGYHSANLKFQIKSGAFFCILLLLNVSLMAQQKDLKKKDKFKALVIEAQYSPGWLLSVHSEFPHHTFSNTVELHIGYQTYGEKQWNSLFNYPRLGVSFIYQNVGNNQVFGHQFSIVPTVYFSTAHREDAKVFAEIRYGLGLACFNQVYNANTNPHDFGVGAHFTWQFTLGANLRWNFSKYAGLQLGGVLYHASDAHTVLPNVGANNVAGYIGLVIKPFGNVSRTHSYDSLGVEDKWHFNVRFGAGYNRKGSAFYYYKNDHTKYPVYTIAVFASKRFSKVIMFKAGIIYRYYEMYHNFLLNNDSSNLHTSNVNLKSSAFIAFTGMEFMLGHFAISVEAGINMYKPAYKPFFDQVESSSAFNYWSKQLVATRFGLNYYIFDPYKHLRNDVYVGAYVSANLGQAEFIEFNLGYVF